MNQHAEQIISIAEARSKRMLPQAKGFFERLGERPKKPKMKYRHRAALSIVILTVVLMIYILMFFAGNPLGDAINDWTDSVVSGFLNGLVSGLGSIFGKDWSDMGARLGRIMTLGPLSFIIVAALFSFVVSCLIAWIYGRVKTRNATDDGTSNFVSEESRREALLGRSREEEKEDAQK